MDNENKNTIFQKLFANGLGIYLLTICCTFLLNRLLNFVWLSYAPIVVVGIYIIWAFISIYSSKSKPMLNLSKSELLFYQIVIPIGLSILTGAICIGVTGDAQMGFFDNVKVWIFNSENHLFLSIVFSILVLLCYFIAFERIKICEDTKTECQFSGESIELHRQNKEKLNEISGEIGKVQTILEGKSQVGYTATCIPIKYNKEHDTFVLALIRNLSHEESQWMFPGSHVEVSNNQLREVFELTDISIVPSKVIGDKVKKEAGLLDLQFIDPYYEAVSYENTVNGKEERNYPNTCYPEKAPVFNYIFRVSKSAKCYKNQNHRCHYDFTYIGEYSEINEREAEYEVVEIELNRNRNFKEMEHTEAIAHITSKLGDQINKKLKAKVSKKSKNHFNTPFDQLCLDSIPEMIYNAILFYIDYKGL
jgi:hypothetical protein